MTGETGLRAQGRDVATHGVAVLGDALEECNGQFCAMLGRAPEELVGRSLLTVCPQVQSDGAFSSERWQRRSQAAAAGLPQWFPWQFRNAEGKRVHALVHLAAADADGRLVAQVHDLSGFTRAGWIKPESAARLQDVLDHTKAVIFVKDMAGRYVFANRELERVVRVPAAQIVGRTDHELWPPEVARHFRENDVQVLQQRTAIEFEVKAEVGRQQKTFLSFKFPLFTGGGEPYAVCGIATDITERKRTEDALAGAALAVSSARGGSVFQELVRYLATLLEVDAAFIAAPCPGGAGWMRMHAFLLDGEVRENFDYPIAGTPCETIVGQSFRIYPSALKEHFPNDLDFDRLGAESYAGYPLRDGAGAPLGLISVVSRSPMTNAEFVESILKIFAVRAAAELERERAEQTLRESEERYRLLFEMESDAIVLVDATTLQHLDVNRAATQLYGYSREELLELRSTDVSAEPDRTSKSIGLMDGVARVPLRWHRKKDGTVFPVEITANVFDLKGRRIMVAAIRDITERKRAEEERARLEAQLRQAQKMEALGHLTGGIAHDFNNLLTSILGYVVLAAEQPAAGGDARLRRYLDQAQQSCERARDLIQQMLTFSRGQRGEPRPVALAPLVIDSVNLFSSSLPARTGIELELGQDAPPVMIDPVQLDQILLNLCLNARDAIEGAGTITVSISRLPAADVVCTACRQGAAGDYVQLCVEDDGPGIAPEVVDRIFEPFFTTKEVGKGSGMGLASVHGIVHELGGHIVVDTAPGRGTRFCILLPALEEGSGEEAVRRSGGARGAQRRLSGRVLIVDDERSVAAFMGDLLESWGLEVVQAASGSEALAMIAGEAPACDLVITDQTMPRMTGVQLARELLVLRPELPVVLYTGRTDGVSRADIEASRVRAVIGKPVDAHELFGVLQAQLRDAASR